MNIRHLAAVAAFVPLTLWAGAASPAQRKPQTHAYVVRAADGGWWRVAHARGVTLPQLLAANHATTATPLKVGQTIQLPASARPATKSVKPLAAKPVAPAPAPKR